ncbi:MAG: hypothetical protein Q7T82_18195 [Armatimonadota bacterium]|nr:hypothetical protein [Armatimonadota bacterium]
MAISITKTDVKRKLMIATGDTSYDSAIDSLIAEMQPAVEYSVEPSYLADTGNSGLQATLKLGLLEIVCGEFLEQVLREVGASEEFTIAGMTLGDRKERGAALLQQGTDRLAPYLKARAASADVEVTSTTLDSERELSGEPIW